MRKVNFGCAVVGGALIALFSLNGCAFYPNFEEAPVYRVPVSEVINQVRCELYDFLQSQEAVENPNFSLNTKSYATVKLTLSTTGYGDVKFAKIDTKKLGLASILAIGSSSQPFPSLDMKSTGQTVADVTVNVSQNPKDLSDACGYGKQEIFSNAPHADRTLINDLRISSWLKRTFASGQRIQSQGDVCNIRGTKGQQSDNCSVSLETATLSTKFQLVTDVNAGVLKFANLIPVVATPVLDLNVDYYHQIQIIFSGNNAVAESKQGRLATVQGAPGRAGRFTEKQLRHPPSEEIPMSAAEAAILRQLRSIRDATILNAQPR